MLTLHAFRKSYGDQLVLDIPELVFEPGIHWVKGKNGSGKSTLFNCLAGLSPYEGDIQLGEHNLKKSPIPYKLSLNYSQSEPIFPEFLSGNDLLNYFGQLKGASKVQVNRLAEQLSVDTYADQPVGNYSSGMLKKLSLVIAFLGNPTWIILDEPLITLDKEAQGLVMDLITKKAKEGVSFIFATHQDFENKLIEADYIYEVKDQTISAIS